MARTKRGLAWHYREWAYITVSDPIGNLRLFFIVHMVGVGALGAGVAIVIALIVGAGTTLASLGFGVGMLAGIIAGIAGTVLGFLRGRAIAKGYRRPR